MAAEKKDRRRLLLMSVLGLAYFFSNFHRLALSVLAADIQTGLSLTSLQIGSLGSAIFYAYAAMQIPCGFLADRISARKIIAASCAMTAVSTLWFSAAQTFPAMVCARVLTGASTALVYIPALVTIRRCFGDRVYGTMTGIMVAMGQLGAVCASYPLKALNDLIGWRAAFTVIGLLMALLALLAWRLIEEENAPSGTTVSGETRRASGGAWKAAFLCLLVWFFLTGGSRMSFQSLWGTRFFTAAKAVDADAASVLQMCVSLGCIAGSLLLGRISDRLGNGITLTVSTLAFAAVWVGLALTPPECSLLLGILAAALGVMGGGGFSVGFSFVRCFAETAETGRLTGLCNCVAFAASALFTQLCGGVMDGFPPSTSFPPESLLLLGFAALSLIAAGLIGFGASAMKKGSRLHEEKTVKRGD